MFRSSIRLISASIISSYGVVNLKSRCDDTQQNKNENKLINEKCELYNSIFQRLSFAERSNRCAAEVGCRFDGGSVTGSCVSIIENDQSNDSNTNQTNENKLSTPILNEQSSNTIPSDSKKNTTSDANIKLSEELCAQEGNEGEIFSIDPEDFTSEVDIKDLPGYLEILESTASKKIHGIINEQIAAQASGQLNSSKEILFDTVKSNILEAFYIKENPKLFGEFLGTILGYDQVKDNTRSLIYWSLATNEVLKGTKLISKQNIQYYVIGDAKEYSRRQMAELLSWWLKHPETPSTVLKPQLDWFVAQPSTIEDFSSALTSTLKSPTTQVRIYLCMYVYYVHVCVYIYQSLSLPLHLPLPPLPLLTSYQYQ